MTQESQCSAEFEWRTELICTRHGSSQYVTSTPNTSGKEDSSSGIFVEGFSPSRGKYKPQISAVARRFLRNCARQSSRSEFIERKLSFRKLALTVVNLHSRYSTSSLTTIDIYTYSWNSSRHRTNCDRGVSRCALFPESGQKSVLSSLYESVQFQKRLRSCPILQGTLDFHFFLLQYLYDIFYTIYT